MFVGHAALAFAIAGLGGRALGVTRRRSLALATLAAVAATLPDVDMVYALTGLLAVGGPTPIEVAHAFFAASTAVHRSVTHSLIVAVPTAGLVALVGRGWPRAVAGATLGIAVVAVALVASPLMAAIGALFVGAAGVLGIVAARLELDATRVGVAALVGFVSHPFGDLFTGQPPALLFPLDAGLFGGRVAIAADPTLHLIGAFGVELAAIWAGLLVFARLRGRDLAAHLRPRAAFGGAYATAIVAFPPPTVDAAYRFVGSVLAVGVVGALPLRRRLPDGLTVVTTGLAGVTVAGAAYALAYLLRGVLPTVFL
ncbi:MAG: metal-dependent hydrolase [Halanaeroarchaeum sp.]